MLCVLTKINKNHTDSSESRIRFVRIGVFQKTENITTFIKTQIDNPIHCNSMKNRLLTTISVIIPMALVIFAAGCKKPKDDPDKVRDIDGNVYTIVKIGTQEWLDMNLNVTHYRNGDPVTAGLDVDPGVGGWMNYNNSEANGLIYGKLYNSYAVHDSRGLAPAGWRVATKDDFEILIEYLGGNDYAGGKLKQAGLQYWAEPNVDGSDEYGFRALPGGYSGPGGAGSYLGNYASFWTSTKIGPGTDETFNYWVYYNNATIQRDSDFGRSGFSVRCVRDR